MLYTRKSLYDRSLEKTPEQLFINSLRKEFELSPAESQGLLDLAKSCLFGEVPQTLGKVRFLCASVHAKHGKPLSEQDKVRVELTVDNGVEDLDVQRLQGQRALRQLRILRLTEEAWSQDGILKQEYGLGDTFRTKRQVRKALREAVYLYNTRRPHVSLNYRVPSAVHQMAA